MDTRQGWDVERDSRMADYANTPIDVAIEPYDPDKDPVAKGLTDPDGRVE
ncbi:hypothetical protein [Cumulibacter soli]|nr:hypothetical protein [Cumulibacter soli]